MPKPALLIAVLLGIPVIGFVVLLFVLDNPEIYKDRLSAEFRNQTGLTLKIDGDVSWRYLPPIAINITQLTIANPNYPEPLAQLGEANIDLKLLPLIFGGNVEVDGLLVSDLTVNALVNASGKANWEPDALTGKATDTDSASTSQPEEDVGSSEPMKINLSNLFITNATVNYKDAQNQEDYQLKIKSIQTGALTSNQPTSFEASIAMKDNTADMSADTAMKGKLTLNETFSNVKFDGFEINATVTQPNQPTLEVSTTINGRVDTDAGTAEFDNTMLSLGDMVLTLTLKANNIMDVPGLRGNVSSNQFDGKALSKLLAVDLGTTANPNAFRKVKFSAELSGTTDEVVLSSLVAQLDTTNITGQLTATLAPKMKAAFMLNMDAINASDYLEPEAAVATNAPAGGQASSGSANSSAAGSAVVEDSEMIPVDTLAETDLDGTLKIKVMQYDTYTLSDFALTVKNTGGKLTTVITGNAYSGTVKADVSLNDIAMGKSPSGTSTVTVTGIKLAEFLEFDSVTGQMGLTANHQFRGKMMSEILNTVDGKSEFNIKDGTLDVRAVKKLAVMVDSLQGKTSSISQWPDDLPFKQLLGQHTISKGIAADQNFNLGIENMNVTGKGGVDYFANTLNFDIEVTLLENVGGQFTVNPQLANIRWPLHCEGSLDADPVGLCFPDSGAITSLLRDVATQELKRKGTKKIEEALKDKIPEETKEKAKSLLKGLFN